VQRRYTGLTPLGLTFSKVAGLTTGGIQNHGFYACALKTIMAPKFLSADGGWDRIVWMARTLKEQLLGFIPEEIYTRIATEDDAVDPNDLKEYLKRVKHPVTTKYWKDGEPQPLKLPASGEMWPGDEEYLPL
jgi:acetyl-CoA decarbonylase/synthase complex subunit beta